jgi:hypothetical protein
VQNPSPREWTDEEVRALEDPEQWDWDSAELVGPSSPGGRGADVTVALDRQEFRLVARAAKARGAKLTDFMRKAAVEQAAGVLGETCP